MSPHTKAVYEAGKTLLTSSITAGRELCQYMMTASTGAIPIYLAILKFILPKQITLEFVEKLILALPAIIFFLASFIFALGLFPTIGRLSIDTIEYIESIWESIIRRRHKMITLGFALFGAGVIAAIVIIIRYLGKS